MSVAVPWYPAPVVFVRLRRLNPGFAGKFLEFTAAGTDVELKIRGWAKSYTGETRYAAAQAFINDADVQGAIRELGPSKRALKAMGHRQSLDSPCKRIRSDSTYNDSMDA